LSAAMRSRRSRSQRLTRPNRRGPMPAPQGFASLSVVLTDPERSVNLPV
jgi:hypothetical protein